MVNNEMLRKLNKGLIITIIVLAIMLILLSAFVVYDKLNESREIDSNKEQTLNIKSKLVENLFGLMNYTGCFVDGSQYGTDKIVTPINLKNINKLYIVINQLLIDKYGKKYNDYIYDSFAPDPNYVYGLNEDDVLWIKHINSKIAPELTDAKIESKMKQIFGEDVTYSDTDTDGELEAIDMVGSIFKHDENLKGYISKTTDGGIECVGIGPIYQDMYKAIKKGNIIEIYSKFGFIGGLDKSKVDLNMSGLYKDANHKTLITTYLFSDEYNFDFTKYSSKLSSIKYTFEKNSDGTYRFVLSEIIE